MAFSRAICAAALVLALGSCGDDDDGGGAQRVAGLDVATVADRVEKARQLEFENEQKVEVADQDRILEIVEDLVSEKVREAPENVEGIQRNAASLEGVLALSGLIRTTAELKPVGGGDEIGIGGAYIPEEDALYVVEEATEQGRDLAEVILAHELTHALEDQHFARFQPESVLEPVSDAALARQALAEGSAQLLEVRYSAKHVKERLTAKQLVDRELERVENAKITPGLRPLASFPYLDGAVFIRRLSNRDRGGWRLVNEAHRRPPTTTEQIFHPVKWLKGEVGTRPALPVEDAIPSGFRKLGGAELGELLTRTILASGVSLGDARAAAAGWGGGSYEVYYSDRLPTVPCGAPCREATIGVLAWTWDTARDAEEFRLIAQRYVDQLTEKLPDGAVALGGRGTTSAIVFAPSPELAAQIANQEVPAG